MAANAKTTNMRTYNIDDIKLSQSPTFDQRPRYFQPQGLILHESSSSSPDEDATLDGDSLSTNILHSMTNYQSSQVVSTATGFHQELLSETANSDDNDQELVSQTILTQLNLTPLPNILTHVQENNEVRPNAFEQDELASVQSSCSTHVRSYPPIRQSGYITEHDRPYAEYGHLDATTIAQRCHFDLNGIETQRRRQINLKRMEGKSWAITAWTEVSKATVLEEIRRQFDDERLQYVCIASERNANGTKAHLHVQIITKRTVNKKSWFLDEITGTHCNYQVTNNDKAWNEYIKKGGDFIEFGEFKSPSSRGAKQWPELPPQLSDSSLSPSVIREALVPVACPASVRNSIEERRQRKLVTAERALLLAQTDVSKAMDLIREAMPMEFMAHSSWYLTTFNYVRLQAQRKVCETNVFDAKKYRWPTSFPDCTPALREAMDRWIRHHFARKSRAKCLILIGPTGVGKTSFALSLPGLVNYFKGRWHLDNWNPLARYCVYDDIGWDNFEKLNYPSKKDLLTQNGLTGATDKYRHSTMINVIQPAIVLLNPGKDEGSLTAEPRTKEAEEDTKYWKKRAFIYRMGSDEYFYKRPSMNDANCSGSSNSTMGPDEERFVDIIE